MVYEKIFTLIRKPSDNFGCNCPNPDEVPSIVLTTINMRGRDKEHYINHLEFAIRKITSTVLDREQQMLDIVNGAKKTIEELKIVLEFSQKNNLSEAIDTIEYQINRNVDGIEKFEKLLNEPNNIFEKAKTAISHNNKILSSILS